MHSCGLLCNAQLEQFVNLSLSSAVVLSTDSVTEFQPKSALDDDARESVFLLRYY